MFVAATVISSEPSVGRRVLDAGTKAVDLLSGMPCLAWASEPSATTITEADATAAGVGHSFSTNVPAELAEITFANGGDEHGILHNVPDGMLPIGTTVMLTPSHCDPTVNLHDQYVGFRGGICTDIFPIDAKGW